MTRAYDLACGGEGGFRKGQKLANWMWEHKIPQADRDRVPKDDNEINALYARIDRILFYMSDAEFDKALSSE